jgi:hypothetical protein
MADQEAQEPSYHVHFSGTIAEKFKQPQRRATRQGRGTQALAATKHILGKLEEDPNNFGEPLYGLPNLKMQVRTCSVRPLVVDFAVHEELPLVFLKGVWLLPE